MKTLRVGIVGFGNLGRAMTKLLALKGERLRGEGLDLRLDCILGRHGGLWDAAGLDWLAGETERYGKLELFPGFDSSLNFERIVGGKMIDLLVEFTPTNKETGEPGLTHIREALQHGIHVITGNKGPILLAWEELASLAASQKLLLGIGCTTGGALPSLLNGREGMAGSDVTMIEGILNGTSNYILNRMEGQGANYAEALAEAQIAGIAEADPAMDVEGWDTAVKLAILVKVAMRVPLSLSDIAVEGITHLTPAAIRDAQRFGRKIRLMGRAVREGEKLTVSVAPRIVDAAHPFYFLPGKDKCVRYVSDTLGEVLVSGGASGPLSSAASALRDVVNAWRSGLLR